MKWFKWRGKWREGPESTWNYFLENPEFIEERIEAIKDLNYCGYSDAMLFEAFRGIEYEQIEHPPEEWIKEKIKELDGDIRASQNMKEILLKILKGE